MAYHRIEMALKSLGLAELYLQNFVVNKIDDNLLQDIIHDSQQLLSINEIIPIIGDRIRFYKAFNSIEIATVLPDSSFEGSYSEASTVAVSESLITVHEPRPLQIMDFGTPKNQNGPSEVTLHRPIFQHILTKTKTKKVALLSIAGPSRKGKSFFLNFVLRYLDAKKTNNANWTKSDDEMERLNGFEWKNCTDRVTTGIWLWSEPFQMKSTNGEEFDLLIMDTQGVFDEHTTQREWSILVGLGLLASSSLIFNIAGDLQEDKLQIFEKFLDFGLMALEGEDAKTPFQNLVFLIRDWNFPGEFPYGFIGGSKYIKSKLDDKKSHKESHTKVRQQIKECFEDISCCLLPHPGEEFVTWNFGGFVDSKFTDELENCITELMDPVNIPVKKINGNEMSATDILEIFSKYCDFFNSNELPNPDSILQVMVKHNNEMVIKKCVDNFTSELNTQLAKRPFFLQGDLSQMKRTTMRSCMEIFEMSRKMGDQSMLKEAKNEFLRQVEEFFTIIKEKNAHNLDIVTSEAFDSALTEYETIVSQVMKKGYLSISAMDSLLTESEVRVCGSFASACGVDYIGSLPDKAEKFRRSIKSKNSEFRNENTLRKHEEEKQLDAEIQNLVAHYVEKMEDRTKGRIVSGKEVEELDEICRKQSFDEFSALKTHKDFVVEAETNLKTKIDVQCERIKEHIKGVNQKINFEGNSLITQAANTYFDTAKANISANEKDFEQHQQELLVAAKKTIIVGCPIDDAQFLEKLYRLLDDEIVRCNQNLKDIFELNKNDILMKLRKAQDDAIPRYKFALDELRSDVIPVEYETLEETHTREMQVAIQSLEKCFQDICVMHKGVERILFENYKTDLETRINSEYDSFKQLNELRRNEMNARAAEIFTKAKESYLSRIKEEANRLTNEDQLEIAQSEATKEISENLQRELKALHLSSGQNEKFMTDLHSYIESEFDGILEVWELKMDEDENIVKTAFLDAREFYKDEMEKHFQSKVWLEVSELQQTHEMIMDAAIERGRNEVDISDRQELHLRELINNLFRKYHDKNLLRMPTDDYAVGIDLGTTNSCVAVCIKGNVTVISENEKTTIPSYVAFKEDHTIDVGEAAKEQTFRRPECTIFDAKRLIGRKFSDKIVQDDMKLWPFEVVDVDKSDRPKIKIPGHEESYYPEQISARVLAHLKKMAEDFLNREIKNAVVTVPAYFNESQKQATKHAAQIAGLNAQILNEPTSAAISYELHRTDNLLRNVLIFDLGGGTFDVAVLEMIGGEITVKAINGDTHLGGEDFDNEMVKHVIEVVKQQPGGIDLGRGKDSSDPQERRKTSERLRRIRAACEKQKRLLSTSDSVEIAIPRIDDNFNLEVTFTRAEFEKLNLAKFKACIDITATVISDAKMVKSDIDDIALIGGSTRIPKVRELLTEYFDGKALNKQINADEAVAYGAAIRAALIFGKRNEVKKNIQVKDVTPMSLGIEVHGGGMSVIIGKNTSIPCSKKLPYYTVYDWQTSVDIRVFEGENTVANANNKLGTFVLSDIPSAPKHTHPLDISMTIDAEGILHVEGVCRTTEKSTSITIVEHKGRMSVQEIESAQLAVCEYKW